LYARSKATPSRLWLNRGLPRPLYSGRGRLRHPSCPAIRTGDLVRFEVAAMSATRSARELIEVRARPSPPFSPRAGSGGTARLEPSLAAAFIRAAACATGRTAPDSDTSPK